MSWVSDLRQAARSLGHSPGLLGSVVITLALGTGANLAIFSVVNAVVLKAFPYKDPGRLVMLWRDNQAQGEPRERVPYLDLVDWRARSRSFSGFAGFHKHILTLTSPGEPAQIIGAGVTSNFFPLLGVRPLLGRTFHAVETPTSEEQRVVVLSHRLWQNRYGSDPKILGKPITVNGEPYTVIGIMPPRFGFPIWAELWLPPATASDEFFREAREAALFEAIGRLAPAASLEGARREMQQIARQLAAQYPQTNGGRGASLEPLRRHVLGRAEVGLYLLLGASGLLLLIGCVNVASLLLARALVRSREVAIRSALGAARGRIVRQLLTESFLLALLGCGLGLWLAHTADRLLAATYPGLLPRFGEVAVDGRVLAYTLALAIATALVFGAVPALQTARGDLIESLKEGARGVGGGPQVRRMRWGLVAAEISLAAMLLVCAGLLIRSSIELQKVTPGFNPEGLLTLQISLPNATYPGQQEKAAFFPRVLARLEALPAVRAAGASSSFLLDEPTALAPFVVQGRPRLRDGQVSKVSQEAVTSGYFAALGTPLRRGRLFSAEDDAQAPRVVIVNEEMARRFWPGGDPIGSRIAFWDPLMGSHLPAQDLVWRTVVGVVADMRRYVWDSPPAPEMYMPFAQNVRRSMRLVLRTDGDPLALAGPARAAIWEIDRDLPVTDVRSFRQILDDALATRRFNTLLLTIFSIVGLVLAAVGLYGVISYSVHQSVHEIGIRLALGARPGRVVGHVLWQGAVLTGVGLAVGLTGAWLASRVLASLLYGVTATDSVTFILSPLVLAAVSLLASYLPARRAVHVNPSEALRY
jgi:putative ABC transport system permease protein